MPATPKVPRPQGAAAFAGGVDGSGVENSRSYFFGGFGFLITFAVATRKFIIFNFKIMKKAFVRGLSALLVTVFLFGSTSCIGSFSLTNRLLGWNRHVGNKFLNELVFFAFWVLPVYEVTGLADLLVLNSIEFWSGRNPMGDTAATEVEASNGDRVRITPDAEGYDLVNLTTDEQMRLEYDADIDGWAVEYDGTRHVLFTFVDDTHIAVPVEGGQDYRTVELSNAGLMAYAALSRGSDMACK